MVESPSRLWRSCSSGQAHTMAFATHEQPSAVAVTILNPEMAKSLAKSKVRVTRELRLKFR